MVRETENDPPDFDPVPGVAETVAPGVRRVLAPNPSPMTFRGTNSYLVGTGDAVALIDPGPLDLAHADALDSAIGDAGVSHVLVTHAHLDHAPLARVMGKRHGAPVLAFGDALAGRSAVMAGLVRDGLSGGGEGVDHGFAPDICLVDGAQIAGAGWTLRAWHSPGHMGNHMCFQSGGTVFSGDLVMGWSTSLVSPPDGDLADFMESCRRLRALAPALLLPGHGAPVTAAIARIDTLIAHRDARTAQILAALGPQNRTVAQIARAVYRDLPEPLMPAAERNVFAHLIVLEAENRVEARGPIRPDTGFATVANS